MKGIPDYSNEQLCSEGNSDAPERKKAVDPESLFWNVQRACNGENPKYGNMI